MATEIDQAFVEYVVKALVANPDAVQVKRTVDDMGVLLELTVDPADMGKVIGKAGATAKSIRTLLRVLGAKSDSRVNLKIVEPEGEGERTEAVEAVKEEPEPTAEDETDIKAQTKKELEELADLEL
ncbi:MAG TPA: KH domain-containing protein [Candidatus Saccharimonadales bacterium]|nr:KH domain-containing protein [Candidatus Saccharimonadales bacterium]